MTDAPVCDRVLLYDTDGKLIETRNLIPPFDKPPDIVIMDARYFVLYDDGHHHEATRVHWLPKRK